MEFLWGFSNGFSQKLPLEYLQKLMLHIFQEFLLRFFQEFFPEFGTRISLDIFLNISPGISFVIPPKVFLVTIEKLLLRFLKKFVLVFLQDFFHRHFTGDISRNFFSYNSQKYYNAELFWNFSRNFPGDSYSTSSQNSGTPAILLLAISSKKSLYMPSIISP